jgi:predicted ATPase/DNA-binding SARP family transcriptional activator
MEVRIGSHPLPRLRSRKGLWLLALLALRAGRDVERRWLGETLWPEGDAAAARRNLRQTLHDLRLALGPEARRLASEAPRMLRLDVDGASVDVLAFDAALADGDSESLESAVHLYRGPLLEECTEEWIQEERRQREQSYVTALERLATLATAKGEHASAASTLRLAVGARPYREDLQRVLMQSLAASGKPVEALVVYRHLRVLLWRDLTAQPAEETTALFRRLRDESRARPRSLTPSLAPPLSTSSSKGNLPQPLSAFVGREQELREVGTVLGVGQADSLPASERRQTHSLPHARLVTLTGTGGIGKTRLAIRLAEECAWGYADGAWFVDLAALADPALVPQAVARALQVRETPDAPLTETLQEALAGRQLLLVLDNCEHLLDACARLVDALLSACLHLRILATSRQPLGLTGEVAWRVPSLSLPEGRRRGGPGGGAGPREAEDSPASGPSDCLLPSADCLLASGAIRLFVHRAQAAMPGFALREQNAPAVLQVCRRLDGIPLAIELAAARLKALSIEQIAARLHDRFRLLTGGSRAALPRQQTLRATLDWSHDLLSGPERILLRRLSVFAGGCTLEAAEAVCTDGGSVKSEVLSVKNSTLNTQHSILPLEEWQVLDLLTQLVDRSLVGVERRGEAARYLLLETTREYAQERLREAGEDGQMRARHAHFFLAMAERAEPELRGPAQAEWLQCLEEEHDNLRLAIDYFLTQREVAAGLRLGGALESFWWIRGYLSEGRERLLALLAHSGYKFESLQPGVGDEASGPTPNAQRPTPNAESRPPHIRRAQAKALNAAGVLADDQSDFAAARALFQESLELYRQLGDERGAAMTLINLGGQALQARDFPSARALYEESLAIWREVGDPWWTASALSGLGRVALHARDFATARALVGSALELQRQLRDRRAIARSLTALGSITARLDDYETAHALYEESLAISRELGARGVIEETLSMLGNIGRDRGDLDAVLAFHGERLPIARELGNASGVAESLYYLGLVARARGDESRAGTLWSESLAISQGLGDNRRIAECLEGFASLAVPSSPREPHAGELASDAPRATGDRTATAERAARLFGVATALRERARIPLEARDQPGHDRQLAAVRAILDAASFTAAWEEGRAMPLDEVIATTLRESRVAAERRVPTERAEG